MKWIIVIFSLLAAYFFKNEKVLAGIFVVFSAIMAILPKVEPKKKDQSHIKDVRKRVVIEIFDQNLGWKIFKNTWLGIFFKKSYKWKEEDACRHFFITGETGSGKTAGGADCIVDGFLNSGTYFGGWNIEFKNDYSYNLEKLFKKYNRFEKIKVLRAGVDGQEPLWRFDLFHDRSISWRTYVDIIVETAISLQDGAKDGSNPFFPESAKQYIEMGFIALDEIQRDAGGSPPNLFHAFETVINEKFRDAEIIPYLKQIKTEKAQEALRHFESLKEGKARETIENIEKTVSTYIKFYSDPTMRSIFCSDNPNCHMGMIDDGTLFSLSVSQKLQTERRIAMQLLKFFFNLHWLQRQDLPREEVDLLLPLVGLYDECQTTLSPSAVYGDHLMASVARASRVIFVFMTQSRNSGLVRMGKEKMNNLAENLCNGFVFRSAVNLDNTIAELDEKYLGDREVTESEYSYSNMKTSTRRVKKRRPWYKRDLLQCLAVGSCVIKHVEYKNDPKLFNLKHW